MTNRGQCEQLDGGPFVSRFTQTLQLDLHELEPLSTYLVTVATGITERGTKYGAVVSKEVQTLASGELYIFDYHSFSSCIYLGLTVVMWWLKLTYQSRKQRRKSFVVHQKSIKSCPMQTDSVEKVPKQEQLKTKDSMRSVRQILKERP